MNLYNIQQELIDLFNIIEENEGELTPELEEQLNITEEDFRSKIKDYTQYINSLNYEQVAIKEEINRLKKLYDNKDKTINRLKSTLIDAIDKFGDTTKTGTKYIDYGTGKVSIRKSHAVDVNEDLVEEVETAVTNTIQFSATNNQLSTTENMDVDVILEELKEKFPDLDISEDDIANVGINIQTKVPLKELCDIPSFNIIKSIINSNNYPIFKASVNKKELKDLISENNTMPNLARIIENKNLIIK